MPSRLDHYIRALFQERAEMPWYLPAFGAVLLSVSANLFYDLMKERLQPLGSALVILGLVVLGVLVIWFFEQRRLTSLRIQGYRLSDKPKPQPHKGLIALVSRRETLVKAIEYHAPTLEHCWLITTPETAPLAATLSADFPRIRFYPHGLSNEYDTQGCYAIINSIYGEARRLGLQPSDLIADITGGTKPMTAAMVIACMTRQDAPPLAIEHVPTPFQLVGNERKPIGPLEPIQILIEGG